MDSPKQNFRIDKISIRDYKGIDSLDLEFPRPKFEGDPDIFVIGSRNGLGKTSVLECCAWGLSILGHNQIKPCVYSAESLLRVSSQSGQTKLTYSDQDKSVREMLFTYRDQGITPGEWPEDATYYVSPANTECPPFFRNYAVQSSNPTIDNSFLYFPDNRFIRKLPVLVEMIGAGKNELSQISTFKIRALSMIMGKSGLIEGLSEKGQEEQFEFLNRCVEDFTECELSDQIKRYGDNAYDIRVRLKDGQKTDTFSFDGLSSGQKEMISTLFLIWENTRHASKVVLIDEPEQHLNAEWHRLFVHMLHKIVPWNQYILATHSKHIMSAVDEDRRIMLVPTKE